MFPAIVQWSLTVTKHSCERVKVIIEDLGGGICGQGKRGRSRGEAGGR
jgi:hypothetical protein